MKRAFSHLIWTAWLSLLLGCTEVPEFNFTVPGGSSGIPTGPAEKAYCPYLPTQRTSFGSGSTVTITGSAAYHYRKNEPSGGGQLSTTSLPIRYAEVRVVTAANEVIQCAETDNSGNFSFLMPTGSTVHYVQVLSRANNQKLKASVLSGPESNAPYELVVGFVANTSKTLSPIIAQANASLDPAIRGGAFYILDQLLKSNDYLRTQTANCSIYSGCTPFTVAPKIVTHWRAGFNPGSYFSSGPVSFYLPGQSMMFILGGENGDVDYSDTDHFDPSVIIHEYGHYLEDAYSQMNSPGGSHDGNSIIDPRLAWSEGWGYFFQAAVLNINYIRDTQGTSAGIFQAWTESLASPTMDIPDETGEGVYHEFSITRALWRFSKESAAGGSTPFAEIWHLLTDTSSGFKASGFHFRNMSLLHKNQTALYTSMNTYNLSTIRTSEKQANTLAHYATPLSSNSALCTTTGSLQPFRAFGDNGSFATSDLFRSNRFYHFNHAGGPLDLTLTYTNTTPVNDLDLYVYNESYRYGDPTSFAGYSNARVSGSSCTSCSERVAGSLPAGQYLINVMAYTGSSPENATIPTVSFNLNLSGTKLCPVP